jgi:integrase
LWLSGVFVIGYHHTHFEKEYTMLGKQAKMIMPVDLRRLLSHVRHNEYALRDRVIVLLSMQAGLRACEIANLTWGMVTTSKGEIGQSIDIVSSIAKKGSGRRVPMHPDLRANLMALKSLTYKKAVFNAEQSIIQSKRGSALKPNSIVNWFVALFKALEMRGCSSHSGRRTFITNAARRAHKAGASLRDVQLLAGHRSIETTQGYIDGDSNAQRRLVALI